MKILILADYYPPDKMGGVGEIAKNLRNQYEAAGHKTWVLTTGESSGETRVIRSSKSLIKGVFLNNIKTIQLIRKQQIDVINMHQSTTTLFLLTKHIPFLYKKFPKVVNSFQVSYFSEFKQIKTIKVHGRTFTPANKEYIEKWIFAPMHILLDLVGFIFSDENTVVSSENKKEFEKSYGRLSRKPVRIIPNGIDVDDFKSSKPKLDKKFLDKLSGKTVLLYVGVFRVRKRVFNLLFALKEARKKNKDIVLVLVGGGRAYEDDILKLATDLGIEDNIIFVGRVPNEKVVEYLNASDVFCLISSYEGMPIAILEAMASSKAILTTSVSGMVDLVSHGEDGYLTEVDDIDDVADKIIKLAADPTKTTAMGKAARAKIEKEYDWRDVAARYLELFKS